MDELGDIMAEAITEAAGGEGRHFGELSGLVRVGGLGGQVGVAGVFQFILTMRHPR